METVEQYAVLMYNLRLKSKEKGIVQQEVGLL